ncbi:MAG TPA: M48 family metallopeptidase [Beijerinckiaceae bacterium]|nr:M48 family metallopeptidase [Beijerinckiaceae bacterium]
MPSLQLAFVLGTIAWSLASVYLSLRQSACVRRHRDAPPADFLTTVSLEDHRKAADYTLAKEGLARWETLADAALALGWALGGIDLLYGGLADAIMRSIGRSLAFLLATGMVSALVSLPFDAYRTFAVEQRFGFNRSTIGRFVSDRLKRALMSLAVTTPLLFGLLFVMRTASGLWWLWAWIATLALMISAPAIYVRIIAPRFNRFEPLGEGALRSSVEAVLARAGFRSSGLFTMDASRRTAHGNAYFIGFGNAKRIVLFDTLIARCTPPEIEAIVAHELGHFKYGHIRFALLRAALVSFVAFAAVGWLTRQAWLLPAFGLHRSDPALALFVCLLLGSLLAPILALLSNWISRRNEYQADDYARRAVGAEPMVSALARLARDNASTLTPDPLYSLVNHSHPTIPLRIRNLRRSEAGERIDAATFC